MAGPAYGREAFSRYSSMYPFAGFSWASFPHKKSVPKGLLKLMGIVDFLSVKLMQKILVIHTFLLLKNIYPYLVFVFFSILKKTWKGLKNCFTDSYKKRDLLWIGERYRDLLKIL